MVKHYGLLLLLSGSVMSYSVQPYGQQPPRLSHSWGSPGKNTGVGCHFLLQCMQVKNETEVAQSCPTLCNPMDCSPLGSSIHGVFQARVLDWGAIAFSSTLYIVIALCSSPRAFWTPSYTRGSSSSVIIFAFSYWSWDSGGKNTGVVCRCLFKWFTFCQDSP